MSRIFRFSVLSAVVAALMLLPGLAHAGPPWISIELPANPLDPATRGALFVVHSYHHDRSIRAAVTCTAEGLVDGQRRSVGLTVAAASRVGTHAVRGRVPSEGTWMVVCASGGDDASATVLADVNGSGEVIRVRVPHRLAENGRVTIPVPVTPGQIDAMLRERITQASAPHGPTGLLLFAALPLGWWIVRRRCHDATERRDLALECGPYDRPGQEPLLN